MLQFELLIQTTEFELRITNSMVKLLFFRFPVTNLRLKNKKFNFELLTRWVYFYFLTFE